ncbi:hypothetical protein ACFL3N_02965, partial [Candidatus Omnitrophota bacterium]
MEEKIDFKKANTQRDRIIDDLSKILTKEALEGLILKSLSFKKEEISQSAFYSYLKGLAQDEGLNLEDKAHFLRYTDYITDYESIDLVNLFEEAKSFELSIENALYRNDTERLLSRYSKLTSLLIGLFNVKLTNGDIHMLKELLPVIARHEVPKQSKDERLLRRQSQDTETSRNDCVSELASLIRDISHDHDLTIESGYDLSEIFLKAKEALSFYETAEARNARILENTISTMRKEDTHVAALITGGYHTKGITDLLKTKKTSYIVILPKFDKDSKERPYVAILTNKKSSSYKRLLDTGKYYLAAEGLFSEGDVDSYVELAHRAMDLAYQEGEDLTDIMNIWINAFDFVEAGLNDEEKSRAYRRGPNGEEIEIDISRTWLKNLLKEKKAELEDKGSIAPSRASQEPILFDHSPEEITDWVNRVKQRMAKGMDDAGTACSVMGVPADLRERVKKELTKDKGTGLSSSEGQVSDASENRPGDGGGPRRRSPSGIPDGPRQMGFTVSDVFGSYPHIPGIDAIGIQWEDIDDIDGDSEALERAIEEETLKRNKRLLSEMGITAEDQVAKRLGDFNERYDSRIELLEKYEVVGIPLHGRFLYYTEETLKDAISLLIDSLVEHRLTPADIMRDEGTDELDPEKLIKVFVRFVAIYGSQMRAIRSLEVEQDIRFLRYPTAILNKLIRTMKDSGHKGEDITYEAFDHFLGRTVEHMRIRDEYKDMDPFDKLEAMLSEQEGIDVRRSELEKEAAGGDQAGVDYLSARIEELEDQRDELRSWLSLLLSRMSIIPAADGKERGPIAASADKAARLFATPLNIFGTCLMALVALFVWRRLRRVERRIAIIRAAGSDAERIVRSGYDPASPVYLKAMLELEEERRTGLENTIEDREGVLRVLNAFTQLGLRRCERRINRLKARVSAAEEKERETDEEGFAARYQSIDYGTESLRKDIAGSLKEVRLEILGEIKHLTSIRERYKARRAKLRDRIRPLEDAGARIPKRLKRRLKRYNIEVRKLKRDLKEQTRHLRNISIAQEVLLTHRQMPSDALLKAIKPLFAGEVWKVLVKKMAEYVKMAAEVDEYDAMYDKFDSQPENQFSSEKRFYATVAGSVRAYIEERRAKGKAPSKEDVVEKLFDEMRMRLIVCAKEEFRTHPVLNAIAKPNMDRYFGKAIPSIPQVHQMAIELVSEAEKRHLSNEEADELRKEIDDKMSDLMTSKDNLKKVRTEIAFFLGRDPAARADEQMSFLRDFVILSLGEVDEENRGSFEESVRSAENFLLELTVSEFRVAWWEYLSKTRKLTDEELKEQEKAEFAYDLMQRNFVKAVEGILELYPDKVKGDGAAKKKISGSISVSAGKIACAAAMAVFAGMLLGAPAALGSDGDLRSDFRSQLTAPVDLGVGMPAAVLSDDDALTAATAADARERVDLAQHKLLPEERAEMEQGQYEPLPEEPWKVSRARSAGNRWRQTVDWDVHPVFGAQNVTFRPITITSSGDVRTEAGKFSEALKQITGDRLDKLSGDSGCEKFTKLVNNLMLDPAEARRDLKGFAEKTLFYDGELKKLGIKREEIPEFFAGFIVAIMTQKEAGELMEEHPGLLEFMGLVVYMHMLDTPRGLELWFPTATVWHEPENLKKWEETKRNHFYDFIVKDIIKGRGKMDPPAYYRECRVVMSNMQKMYQGLSYSNMKMTMRSVIPVAHDVLKGTDGEIELPFNFAGEGPLGYLDRFVVYDFIFFMWTNRITSGHMQSLVPHMREIMGRLDGLVGHMSADSLEAALRGVAPGTKLYDDLCYIEFLEDSKKAVSETWPWDRTCKLILVDKLERELTFYLLKRIIEEETGGQDMASFMEGITEYELGMLMTTIQDKLTTLESLAKSMEIPDNDDYLESRKLLDLTLYIMLEYGDAAAVKTEDGRIFVRLEEDHLIPDGVERVDNMVVVLKVNAKGKVFTAGYKGGVDMEAGKPGQPGKINDEGYWIQKTERRRLSAPRPEPASDVSGDGFDYDNALVFAGPTEAALGLLSVGADTGADAEAAAGEGEEMTESDWHVKRLEEARAALDQGEWQRAERAFSVIVNSLPRTDRAVRPDAMRMLKAVQAIIKEIEQRRMFNLPMDRFELFSKVQNITGEINTLIRRIGRDLRHQEELAKIKARGEAHAGKLREPEGVAQRVKFTMKDYEDYVKYSSGYISTRYDGIWQHSTFVRGSQGPNNMPPELRVPFLGGDPLFPSPYMTDTKGTESLRPWPDFNSMHPEKPGYEWLYGIGGKPYVVFSPGDPKPKITPGTSWKLRKFQFTSKAYDRHIGAMQKAFEAKMAIAPAVAKFLNQDVKVFFDSNNRLYWLDRRTQTVMDEFLYYWAKYDLSPEAISAMVPHMLQISGRLENIFGDVAFADIENTSDPLLLPYVNHIKALREHMKKMTAVRAEAAEEDPELDPNDKRLDLIERNYNTIEEMFLEKLKRKIAFDTLFQLIEKQSGKMISRFEEGDLEAAQVTKHLNALDKVSSALGIKDRADYSEREILMNTARYIAFEYQDADVARAADGRIFVMLDDHSKIPEGIETGPDMAVILSVDEEGQVVTVGYNKNVRAEEGKVVDEGDEVIRTERRKLGSPRETDQSSSGSALEALGGVAANAVRGAIENTVETTLVVCASAPAAAVLATTQVAGGQVNASIPEVYGVGVGMPEGMSVINTSIPEGSNGPIGRLDGVSPREDSSPKPGYAATAKRPSESTSRAWGNFGRLKGQLVYYPRPAVVGEAIQGEVEGFVGVLRGITGLRLEEFSGEKGLTKFAVHANILIQTPDGARLHLAAMKDGARPIYEILDGQGVAMTDIPAFFATFITHAMTQEEAGDIMKKCPGLLEFIGLVSYLQWGAGKVDGTQLIPSIDVKYVMGRSQRYLAPEKTEDREPIDWEEAKKKHLREDIIDTLIKGKGKVRAALYNAMQRMVQEQMGRSGLGLNRRNTAMAMRIFVPVADKILKGTDEELSHPIEYEEEGIGKQRIDRSAVFGYFNFAAMNRLSSIQVEQLAPLMIMARGRFDGIFGKITLDSLRNIGMSDPAYEDARFVLSETDDARQIASGLGAVGGLFTKDAATEGFILQKTLERDLVFYLLLKYIEQESGGELIAEFLDGITAGELGGLQAGFTAYLDRLADISRALNIPAERDYPKQRALLDIAINILFIFGDTSVARAGD